MIKHMVEDGCSDNVIPLPKVTSSILGKLLGYCKKHLDDKEGDPGDSMSWDTEHMMVDQNQLF